MGICNLFLRSFMSSRQFITLFSVRLLLILCKLHKYCIVASVNQFDFAMQPRTKHNSSIKIVLISYLPGSAINTVYPLAVILWRCKNRIRNDLGLFGYLGCWVNLIKICTSAYNKYGRLRQSFKEWLGYINLDSTQPAVQLKRKLLTLGCGKIFL